MIRKAPIAVLLVFFVGIALGALSTYLVTGHAGEPQTRGRAQLVARMTRELGLSAEQQKQLEAVLEETHGKYKAIYEPIRPQMDQARQEGREKIRTFLNAEQKVKFEEILRRIDEERKRGDNR